MSDTDYLIDRGTQELFLCHVDSAKRDRLAYKTPSEYTIPFLALYENVASVQVLEVSIPDSAYSVEADTNTLSFRPSSKQPFRSVQIAIGNHTPDSLMAELRGALAAFGIDVQPLTTPFEIRGQLQFTSPFPFEFDITNTSLKDVIGFSQIIDPVAAVQVQSFSNRIVGSAQDVPVFRQAGDDGDSGAPEAELTDGVVLCTNRHVRQLFRPPTTVSLKKLGFYASLFGTVAPARLRVSVVELDPTGASDAPVSVVRDGGYVDVTYTASPTGRYYEVQGGGEDLVSGATYAVEFWSDTTAADATEGPMLHHAPLRAASVGGSRGGLRLLVDGRWVAFYDLDRAARCVVTGVPFRYSLVPPGIVNLGGFRYLNLRCPEVEQYLNRTRAYENSTPGIAVIPLARTQILKSFVANTGPERLFAAPVQRLVRLSFRFETPNGDLYDFKGVDNTMQIQLRCYGPPRRAPGDGPPGALETANPAYDPDVVRQMREAGPIRDLEQIRDPLPFWTRPFSGGGSSRFSFL